MKSNKMQHLISSIVHVNAHYSKVGAQVKINNFKFCLNIHSHAPNEGLLHWKRSRIEVCLALNLPIEKIQFCVLLVKFDPSSETQLF